jgi:hypothetical protein
MAVKKGLVPAAAATAAVVLVILAVALVPHIPSVPSVLEAKDNQANVKAHASAKSSHSSRHRIKPVAAIALAQRLAAKEAGEELKDSPVVESTEDTYVAARSRVSSLKATLSSSKQDAQKLTIEEADDNAEVKAALLARKRSALHLSDKENVAKEAEQLQHTAHELENQALRDKENSEKDEAEGVAIQQPAAALLKDSKKLNDQSNLVLDQSHSSQAKALAALDLNLAQSLATRASEGMKQAKNYFSQAIDERKRAVAADQAASHDIIDAAKDSLKVNHEVPGLLHVLHGQETGDVAARDVVNADIDAIKKAENRLGQDREAVKEAYSRRSTTIQQVQLAKQQADTLRKELVAAEKSVVQAAKAHLLATKRYNEAAAARKQAEDKVDNLEEKERERLEDMLKAAEQAKDDASNKYKDATSRVDSLSGKQTLLQMQVARLKLQLKEAQMQRESLKEKSEKQRDQISSLQTHLDEVTLRKPHAFPCMHTTAHKLAHRIYEYACDVNAKEIMLVEPFPMLQFQNICKYVRSNHTHG